MKDLLVRRLVYSILVMFGVSFVVFFVIRMAPGDPAKLMLPETAPQEAIDRLREHMGLDKPLHTQYLIFLSRAVRGDFGDSYIFRRPVSVVVFEGLKATFRLAAAASLLTLAVSIPLGVVAAVGRGTFRDHIAMSIAVFGQAMPVFWLGLLLMLIFSLKLGWFPTSGYGGWRHLVLPSITLAAYSTALLTRLTRSAMLDELSKDYVRTARAKGLSERRVIYVHALRNTLLPVITVAGLQVAGMMGGTVVTETVFSYPGVGSLVIDAVQGRDYPLLQYVVLVTSLIFVVVNFAVDLLYTLIDPRVRYQ